MAIPDSDVKSEKLDLRLSVTAKNALQAAAKASGLKLTEFVLESAMARARATSPDRRTFGLNAERWEAFQNALDAPSRDLSRLVAVLRKPSVFDTEL